MNAQQLEHRKEQVTYHKTLQCIGEGKEDSETVLLMNNDPVTCKRSILIPGKFSKKNVTAPVTCSC